MNKLKALIRKIIWFFIDSFAVSFGGSKNPIKPVTVIFFSSSIVKLFFVGKSDFVHIATTRRP